MAVLKMDRKLANRPNYDFATVDGTHGRQKNVENQQAVVGAGSKLRAEGEKFSKAFSKVSFSEVWAWLWGWRESHVFEDVSGDQPWLQSRDLHLATTDIWGPDHPLLEGCPVHVGCSASLASTH